MAIQLGELVKDKVTGLEGIAVSRIRYLNGCIQYGVRPKVKDGKVLDVEYVDEGQLIVINRGINPKAAAEGPGGIMPDRPKK